MSVVMSHVESKHDVIVANLLWRLAEHGMGDRNMESYYGMSVNVCVQVFGEDRAEQIVDECINEHVAASLPEAIDSDANND